MSGVITSLPPLVEQPPGNNSSNPAGLPGVTYVAAIPNLPQTWTALQTFENDCVQFAGSTSGFTFLNATAIASGTVLLPAISGTDTLLSNNNSAVVTNKSIDGLTNTLTNIPTGSLDPDLQALATLTGTGLAVRTAPDTWALRTLTAPAAGITITNPAGVAGNPTFGLANDLAAVEGLASTGMAARTAADTWAVRTIAAGASIGVTNGDGVSGNPTIAVTDAELVALAGVTSAADKLFYFTGSGTGTLADFSVFARTLIDDTTQGAMQVTLGLVPGTNVQVFDSDLAALAANSGTGLWSITGAGTGAVRTLTGPAAGITVSNGGGVAGNPTLALANDLAALEGLSSTGIARRTATDTWSVGTLVSNAELATMAAYTLKGNATGSTAAPTDIDITALTAKASPVSADIVLIQDSAASNAFKKTTVGALSSAGSVSSIAGNTGAFTLSQGLKNATNDLQLDVSFLPSLKSGLTLSTAGSTNIFGITAGVAADSTNAALMKLASAYTKATGAWFVGSGNGALDTGTIATSTWYHVFEMRRPDTGVVDVCISLSSSAPTTGGNIPAAYTQFRRIGSLKTNGSSQWMKFTQSGDDFLWDVQTQDSTGTFGTTASLVTLNVPPNVQVDARIQGLYTGALNQVILVTSPDQADTTPALTNFSMIVVGTAGTNASYDLRVRTNTSGQIRVRSNAASATLWINTYGWTEHFKAP